MSVNKDILAKVQLLVQIHHASYDGSHDEHHIRRVVGLAQLACLLHDVGDGKYKPEYQPSHVYPKHTEEKIRELRAEACEKMTAVLRSLGATTICVTPDHEEKTLSRNILLSLNAPLYVAFAVQNIISGVSFSQELKKPEISAAILTNHPELAVVQDADRLDALGAIGLARLYMYSGANEKRDIGHTNIVLKNLIMVRVGMMKTVFGKEEVNERASIMVKFRESINKEMKFAAGSENWPHPSTMVDRTEEVEDDVLAGRQCS